jgi:hypothetical protein
MNVPVVKATLGAVVSGSVGKFMYKMDNKEAIKSGLITGGSIAVTDTLFSLVSMLPVFFSKLGYYGQDIASSLLDASIRYLVRNKSAMTWSTTNGGFVTDFLVSLGSAVLASYAEAPIRGILPAGLASMR